MIQRNAIVRFTIVLLLVLLFMPGAGQSSSESQLFLPLVFDQALRGRVVFYQYNDYLETAELYTLDLRTANRTRLTTNGYFDGDPAWSPDGAKLAYTTFPQGNGDIFVMNADGTNPLQLTATAENDHRPTWSPDGTQIAFTREFSVTEHSLFVMSANGINVTRLTTGTNDFAPHWSPDGQQLAFASTRDGDWELYVLDRNNSAVTQLTHNDYVDTLPVWSPDGAKLLAVAQGHSTDYPVQLYIMNGDGSNQHFLRSEFATNNGHSWSPDGKAIIYAGSTKFTRELYVRRLDQPAEEVITTPDAPPFDNSLRNAPQWRSAP